MKDGLFNTLVWMGRLFMASLFLFMVIIAIPFAGLFEVADRYTRWKSKHTRTEFID